MALDESSGGIPATMLVGPTGGYGGGGGFGGFGGDWGWIILLLLFAGGGWGNGFGGGWGGMDMYPWLNNSNQINNGFRDQMINDNVTAIRTGLGDISTQLCNGFNGTQMSILQSVNGLQSQLAQCCCDNKSAIADTKYALATEACATRANASDNTNALLTALNGGFQSIKDQLCADKIESKNDLIAQLRSELMFARGQASQDVQTAAIQAGQRALANEVEQYVLPTPRPAYIVQNPNCCAPNYGCGCGA